jgi:malate dehydrogenase (oxaloacetate-decarboxylating)(NADP+)
MFSFFPALGLAVFATEAKQVTDEMLLVADEAVAEQVTNENFENGLIYPRVEDILKVSVNVAVKIAEYIFKNGLAGVERPADIRKFIEAKMYKPVYK